MHFNKNDLTAKNFNQNNNCSGISTNISRVCYTDTDESVNHSETTFDKAKRAFFTPDKANNPKVVNINTANSSFYPKNLSAIQQVTSGLNNSSNIDNNHNLIKVPSIFNSNSSSGQSINKENEHLYVNMSSSHGPNIPYYVKTNSSQSSKMLSKFECENLDEDRIGNKPYVNINHTNYLKYKTKSIFNLTVY